MPNLIPLSAIDSWAICMEIGERLRNVLPVDHSRLPAQIEDRLNRLRELDGEQSPSIIPPMPARIFKLSIEGGFPLDRFQLAACGGRRRDRPLHARRRHGEFADADPRWLGLIHHQGSDPPAEQRRGTTTTNIL